MEDCNFIQFVECIKKAVFGYPLPERLEISDDKFCFQLARMHNVTNLIGFSIMKNRTAIDPKLYDIFCRQYYWSYSHVVSLDAELQKIRIVFEKFGVDFVPLKGSVIRQHYPEKWMRVSSDIDILVREEDLEKSIQILSKELSYQKQKTDDHDVLLLTPKGIHLELHFVLTTRKWKAKEILDKVWDYCERQPEKKHEYYMRDDFLYFYHMFHTAKHFKLGGCGILAVLDTYILNHFIVFDSEKRRDILERGELLLFANRIEEISEKWFSESTIVGIDAVERYILSGGAFGDKQRVIAIQAKTGNRRRFILHRVFPPLKKLKATYPVLRKMPILLPICWAHRLCKSLVLGKVSKAKFELQESKKNRAYSEEVADLFEVLGLK